MCILGAGGVIFDGGANMSVNGGARVKYNVNESNTIILRGDK